MYQLTAFRCVALFLLIGGIAPSIERAYARSESRPEVSGEQTAPPLILPDLEGRQRSLDEWRGKVLLVNFWASWCAPCQAEIPRLVRMQQRYGDKGFQVVGVGIDTARPLANVRRSLGINYPILVLDPESAGPLLRLWGNAARYVPYSVLVDRDNRVVYRQSGEVEDTVFADFVSPRLSHPTG